MVLNYKLCILLLSLISVQLCAAADITVTGKLARFDGTVLNTLGSENAATFQSALNQNLKVAMDFAKDKQSFTVGDITEFQFDAQNAKAIIKVKIDGNEEDAKENVPFALSKLGKYAPAYQFSPENLVMVGVIKNSDGVNLGIRVLANVIKRDSKINQNKADGLKKMLNFAVQKYEGFKELDEMTFKQETYIQDWTKMELQWPKQFPPQFNLNELFSNLTAGKPNKLGQYYYKGSATVEAAGESSAYVSGEITQWNGQPITAQIPDETLKSDLFNSLRVAFLYKSYAAEVITNVEIIENKINMVKVKVSFNLKYTIYVPNLNDAMGRLRAGLKSFEKYASNVHFAAEPVVEVKQRPTGFDIKGTVERRMGSLEGDVNEEVLRDLEKSMHKAIRTVFYFRWRIRIHIHCTSTGGKNAECKVDWDIPNDKDLTRMAFGLMHGDKSLNGPFGAYILKDAAIKN